MMILERSRDGLSHLAKWRHGEPERTWMPVVLAATTVMTMAADNFGYVRSTWTLGFSEEFFFLCFFLGVVNGFALSWRGRATLETHLSALLWVSYLAMVPLILMYGLAWVQEFVWAPVFMGILVGGQGVGWLLALGMRRVAGERLSEPM